jgi:hypothetical protein
VRTVTSLHGSHPTCLVSRGNSLSTNSMSTPRPDQSSRRCGPSTRSAAAQSPSK